MVSVFFSCVVDRGLEHQPSQTKDYQIGICCFFAKHAALRSKNKDWWAWSLEDVSEWFSGGLLF